MDPYKGVKRSTETAGQPRGLGTDLGLVGAQETGFLQC